MGTGVSCSRSGTLTGGNSNWSNSRFAHCCHVPGLAGVSMCQAVSLLCLPFSTDELLQEQKADMDQFLSSISESQPDVTVSSEESEEVPVSEGKPYRPFQVTSLGSRSEPEGERLKPQTQSQTALNNTVAMWRTIGHTHRSL